MIEIGIAVLVGFLVGLVVERRKRVALIRGGIPASSYSRVVAAARVLVAEMEDSPLSPRDRRENAVKQLKGEFPGLRGLDAYRVLHIVLSGRD
jgi:hypothetical protein